MNAPNGTGKGGKSFQDRELSAKVRSLTMETLRDILEGTGEYADDLKFKKAVILKLAGTVLPRLTEHAGEGGDPIQHSITVKFG